jgi:hypothetical protein
MNSAVATTHGNHLFTVKAVLSGVVPSGADGIGLDCMRPAVQGMNVNAAENTDITRIQVVAICTVH